MKDLAILITLLLLSPPLSAACGDIIYVKADALGSNDGSSWQNAYADLEDALTEASTCGSVENIWVAKGTYKPSALVFGLFQQHRSFILSTDVRIWGGFGGWESSLAERNHFLNPTILSGDHGDDDVYIEDQNDPNFPGTAFIDNSYHIMVITDRTSSTRIDGFIFQGGNAIGSGTQSWGAAIYNVAASSAGSSPLIFNCTFQHNNSGLDGGAIHSRGKSEMLLGECRFRSNKSNASGGAFYGHTIDAAEDNTPTMTNTIFWNNLAAVDGGAVATDADFFYGFPEIINCSFTRNKALNEGSAIYYGSLVLGGGTGPDAFIENSIIYQNTGFPELGGFYTLNMNNSILQSCPFPCNTNGNSSQNPLFESQSKGNLRLKKNSPAIDAGFGLAAGLVDLDRNRRDFGTVDMGAYEYLHCPLDGIIHVDSAQAIPADGSAWGKALTDFTMANQMACDCPGTAIIKVAKGTYYPTRNFFGLIYNLDQAKFEIDVPSEIYGGYNSVTGAQTSTTILSGDLSRDDDYSTVPWSNLADNAAYFCTVNTDSFLLDRFTITAGVHGLFVSTAFPDRFVRISSCKFIRNSASGSLAAGAYIPAGENSIVEVLDCSFEENIAPTSTGGLQISVGSGSKSTVDRCSFAHNEGRNVGGLDLASNSPGNSQVQLVRNCLFEKNHSTNGSHAIYISGFQEIHAHVSNCTVLDGLSSNAGIRAIGSEGHVDVTNSLLWNSISPTIRSFSTGLGATINASHCLIEETACPTVTNLTCGPGMIYGQDPLLDADGKPLASSPAIDRGSNPAIGLSFSDLDETPRIQNNTVDIGAFEFGLPCQSNLILDMSQAPFNGMSSLAGTWSAAQSITVKTGFDTPVSDYLILSAPTVTIEGSYERVGGNLLEIIQEGCL